MKGNDEIKERGKGINALRYEISESPQKSTEALRDFPLKDSPHSLNAHDKKPSD